MVKPKQTNRKQEPENVRRVGLLTLLLAVLAVTLPGAAVAAWALWLRSDSSEVTQAPLSAATPASKEPTFSSQVRTVNAAEKAAMLKSGSWHKGCPLAISNLRVIETNYWGFDKQAHQGKIMINAKMAKDVWLLFEDLFAEHYPIHKMQLVDKYRADDETSMRADNSSGYNCRRSHLDNSWSRHSYGIAIDINPLENPAVTPDGDVMPATAKKFVNRKLKVKGIIKPNDAVVKAFEKIGWTWGGDWQKGYEDWQHFSTEPSVAH